MRAPIRPSLEGIALYRKMIEPLQRKRVLALGATPELIDLAISLNAERITSVERNPYVIEAMRRLGERDWSDVELVAGNWLDERGDFYSAFDCIVCDGGLLFLDYPAQWIRLFENILRYLVPGGIFIAKEWAEPPGERDGAKIAEELIDRFELESRWMKRDSLIEEYRRLASALFAAAMTGATRSDGSFIDETIVARLDAWEVMLSDKFPDPEMIEITRSAMLHVARSQPGKMDVVTGVRFDGAEKLLTPLGFETDYYPLPDPPISGSNYMLIAKK